MDVIKTLSRFEIAAILIIVISVAISTLVLRRLRVIEFFRGRPRGGDNFTSLPKCSRPFIQSVASTLSHLKSCNPSGAPHQAPLDRGDLVAVSLALCDFIESFKTRDFIAISHRCGCGLGSLEQRFGKWMSVAYFNSQSPVVHWISETSSLNCLSCRSFLPKPSFTESLAVIQWKRTSVHWSLFRRIPFPKLRSKELGIQIPF